MTKQGVLLVETLAERITRNIRDSRLVNLINYISHFSITAQIKINGHPISSIVTFVVLVFGIVFSVRLLFKYVARPLIYPILRHFFYRIFRSRSNLLPPVENLSKQVEKRKWALIYGATNHIGSLAAKVFASHGYALLLVDANLGKLQTQ